MPRKGRKGKSGDEDKTPPARPSSSPAAAVGRGVSQPPAVPDFPPHQQQRQAAVAAGRPQAPLAPGDGGGGAAGGKFPQIAHPPGGGSSSGGSGEGRHGPPVEPRGLHAGSGGQRVGGGGGGAIDEAFGKQLQLQEEGGASAAPASSKAMRFPARPGFGTLGDKFMVRANHFLVKLDIEQDLCHYRVDITPAVVSTGVNRAVVRKVLAVYGGDFGGRLPVYDGRSSIFTAGRLPFEHKVFHVEMGDQRRERNFKVIIKLVAKVDLYHLSEFLRGRQADVPQEALQALDIVLRELPSQRFTPIGRSFYSPDFGHQDLGEGLEGWRGFYQTLRPTQMGLSLNVNVSATALLQPLPVINYIQKLLPARRLGELRGSLNRDQRREVAKALNRVRVEVTHRGQARRKYRVFGLTEAATRSLTFSRDEAQVRVPDYFREAYNYQIEWLDLPCLNVGTAQQPTYLPMEVCKIVEGQRYPAKQLNDTLKTRLLQMTSQPPRDRERDILRIVAENNYGHDDYVKEFGLTVGGNVASLEARRLAAPFLRYRDGTRIQPQGGAWNMLNRKFVTGGTVGKWVCLIFNPRMEVSAATGFCNGLASKCSNLGMNFCPQPVLPVQSLKPNAQELRAFLARCPGSGKGLDMIIAILPDFKADWYGEFKRICETEVDVVSQCCWTKHALKRNDQYLANVAMKINIKVGGRNTVLVDAVSQTLPILGKTPTIIFGADVTHPSPGEDQVPSVAAVVASQDWPEITTYTGLMSAQTGRVEIIKNLQNMVMDLLKSFYGRTKLKPGRILFYRDGVSEGQFNVVLSEELSAIHKACQLIDPSYRPPVTFVVVQKRHHTRLFPGNPAFADNKNGNVHAGTVVDRIICHPREFDFYLCSHAGILGTSKPAHYHVLWDDNKFSADAMQTLTNSLCSTYARCTRSVSVVPPAYYAHHLATRARVYMGPGGTTLPTPLTGVRKVMFFC